ncbi:MAG: hypothetical protein MJZ20_01450 [Bacteroidaceae bacterium]|nr:hypothetical protein [Bacteroidaceae bacterium]
MQEYYVLRVRYNGTTAMSIYTYDNLKTAEANYYSYLGTDMKTAGLCGGMCCVVSSGTGDTVPGLHKVWGTFKPAPEPEVITSEE